MTDMIKETSGDCYETARAINQQLTLDQTAAFFKKRNVEFGKAQLRTLQLVGEDGTYTNLAFLLSKQCTHTIKLAIFEGSKKSIFRDRCEFSGSLLSQLEEAYDYIDRSNRVRAEFSGLDRLDMRDYPPEAIREALLNAIVHRDYSFSSPTLVSIFEDRIEFVTIGGLVKGVTLEDIGLGVSVLRNQNLANIFYRLRLIEAYGTGILKINECYDEYPVKPTICVSDNAFKIVLPNTNYGKGAEEGMRQRSGRKPGKAVPKEQREKAVVALCRENGSVARRDVQEALAVSQPTAILLMREMVGKGILVKRGGARQVRYYLRE